MKQRTCVVKDVYDAVKFLDEIKDSTDYNKAKSIIVNIYTERCDKDYITYFLNNITKKRIGKAQIAGITCMRGFAQEEHFHATTILTVLFFFKLRIHFLLIWIWLNFRFPRRLFKSLCFKFFALFTRKTGFFCSALCCFFKRPQHFIFFFPASSSFCFVFTTLLFQSFKGSFLCFIYSSLPVFIAESLIYRRLHFRLRRLIWRILKLRFLRLRR